MKMIVMEHQYGVLPGNAVWSTFPMPEGTHEEIWKLQGHKVIDIPDEHGKRLCMEMADATKLQLELRQLYYKRPEPIKITGGSCE